MANEQATSLEDMLGELMRDPARMAQLTQMAASLGLSIPAAPSAEAPEAARPAAEASTGDSAAPAALPALDPAAAASLSGLLPLFTGKGGGKQKPDHRNALLLALKPYLNTNRCEMIDMIVNFGRLGDMLGHSREE